MLTCACELSAVKGNLRPKSGEPHKPEGWTTSWLQGDLCAKCQPVLTSTEGMEPQRLSPPVPVIWVDKGKMGRMAAQATEAAKKTRQPLDSDPQDS